MFKKSYLLVLVCAFGVLSMGSIYGQDIVEINESREAKDNFKKIEKYAPSFYSSKIVDGDIERQDYKMIKKIVKDVEEIYLSMIIKFMDAPAEGIETHHRLSYDNTYRFRSSRSYYDAIVKHVRYNHHLLRSMSLIQSAYDRYEIIKEAIAVDENSKGEAMEIEYKINKLMGILTMFRGSPGNLKKALHHYDHIVSSERGKTPLISDREEQIEIYNYLVGVVHELYEKSRGDSMLSTHYLRKELYYLWKLTDLLNTDNESVKEYKYTRLINNYYSIINFEGNNYVTLYKPYVDKIAASYKRIEEKALDNKRVQPAGNSTIRLESDRTIIESQEQNSIDFDQKVERGDDQEIQSEESLLESEVNEEN